MEEEELSGKITTKEERKETNSDEQTPTKIREGRDEEVKNDNKQKDKPGKDDTDDSFPFMNVPQYSKIKRVRLAAHRYLLIQTQTDCAKRCDVMQKPGYIQ
jgi:hypothetical protein